jgi:hypothetical protein
MFKKLLIKIFRLNDISAMILKAKKKQKQLDEQYWTEKMEDSIEHLKREHSLELQEKDAQISMLEDKIKTYKSLEKELATKEYTLKKEAKENAFMATKIALKVEEFGLRVLDIVGEMNGVKDDAENNRKRIEQK